MSGALVRIEPPIEATGENVRIAPESEVTVRLRQFDTVRQRG